MTGRGCGPLKGTAARVLLGMAYRGVLYDLISNVGKLELAYVHIKGWITKPDVHALLDSPGDDVCLPTHYGEIVHTDDHSC